MPLSKFVKFLYEIFSGGPNRKAALKRVLEASWLVVGFWVFIFAYERIEGIGSVTLLGLGLLFSAKSVDSAMSTVTSLRIISFLRNPVSAFFTGDIEKVKTRRGSWFYLTMQIDGLAMQYNLTEFSTGVSIVIKHQVKLTALRPVISPSPYTKAYKLEESD